MRLNWAMRGLRMGREGCSRPSAHGVGHAVAVLLQVVQRRRARRTAGHAEHACLPVCMSSGLACLRG